MSEKMSDACIVERDGFATMMEILYGLVVIIGITANALVCCVFLSDIRIKNVSLNADPLTLESISTHIQRNIGHLVINLSIADTIHLFSALHIFIKIG